MDTNSNSKKGTRHTLHVCERQIYSMTHYYSTGGRQVLIHSSAPIADSAYCPDSGASDDGAGYWSVHQRPGSRPGLQCTYVSEYIAHAIGLVMRIVGVTSS